MTRQRNDGNSTEFGLWLRERSDLDSRSAFLDIENIDYRVLQYRSGLSLFLEEKRHLATPTFAQFDNFRRLDIALAKADEKYRGFHLLQFEQTSPEDGRSYLDGKEIDAAGIARFLRFEAEPERYESLFGKFQYYRTFIASLGSPTFQTVNDSTITEIKSGEGSVTI